MVDPTAEREFIHQYQLQPLLPRLMSLEDVFLVFEGPLLFLCSKFSNRCVSEERENKNIYG